MCRPVYKLPMTHSFAKSHYRYNPNTGKIILIADIVTVRTVKDRVEWWQPKPDPREVIDIKAVAGSVATNKRDDCLWIRHNGLKCLATDFIAFLKYGRWFRYDPKDGNYCNLKWKNLRRTV